MAEKPTYEELERRIQELKTDYTQLEKKLLEGIAQKSKAGRAQEHTDRYESILRRKNGEKFPVLKGDEPRFDNQSGQDIGSMGVVNDITERKRMEEPLREREEKYRLLFNMGVNAMFLVDNNTTQILECNNKASQLFGYSSQQLLSMKMTDLADKNGSVPDRSDSGQPVYQCTGCHYRCG